MITVVFDRDKNRDDNGPPSAKSWTVVMTVITENTVRTSNTVVLTMKFERIELRRRRGTRPVKKKKNYQRDVHSRNFVSIPFWLFVCCSVWFLFGSDCAAYGPSTVSILKFPTSTAVNKGLDSICRTGLDACLADKVYGLAVD